MKRENINPKKKGSLFKGPPIVDSDLPFINSYRSV
jgi:hypothetical protein